MPLSTGSNPRLVGELNILVGNGNLALTASAGPPKRSFIDNITYGEFTGQLQSFTYYNGSYTAMWTIDDGYKVEKTTS
ncbi:MAG: hypothetical protein LBI64_00940 [Coriobacteriales bacterium]|jgi:hypothetical protein|nr:hypothetical protein [Coriobacteriales bacterium]